MRLANASTNLTERWRVIAAPNEPEALQAAGIQRIEDHPIRALAVLDAISQGNTSAAHIAHYATGDSMPPEDIASDVRTILNYLDASTTTQGISRMIEREMVPLTITGKPRKTLPQYTTQMLNCLVGGMTMQQIAEYAISPGANWHVHDVPAIIDRICDVFEVPNIETAMRRSYEWGIRTIPKGIVWYWRYRPVSP